MPQTEPQTGDLKVWWIPQVPGKPFEVLLGPQSPATLVQAKLVLDTLARYDLFQYENNIKPDYANAGGLQVWDPASYDETDKVQGMWVDWYDTEGRGIEEVPDPATAVWESHELHQN